MPADRRITIEVSATGTRNMFGEYEPGDVTAIEIWASRRDSDLERIVALAAVPPGSSS